MKTTCWYEERRNLVGVFDFRSFHRFFVLVARWRWACFVFILFSCFLLPGAYPRSEGVANLVVFDFWPHALTVRSSLLVSCCCKFGCLYVCLLLRRITFIYIYGGISFWTHAWHLLWLKSCRLSVVCLLLLLFRQRRFDKTFKKHSHWFPLVRYYNSWYNTQYRKGTGSCCLCSLMSVYVFVFMFC